MKRLFERLSSWTAIFVVASPNFVSMEKETLVLFGKRLQELREQENISKPLFYKLTGIDAKTLDQYENGELEPGLMTVMNIAKALNINQQELLKF